MAEVRLPKRIMNSGGWCQGCGHGVVVRLIAEVLDELGVADKAIAVEDVACGSMSMSGVLNCDAIMAAHGRPSLLNRFCGTRSHSSQRRQYDSYRSKQYSLRYDRRTDGSYDSSC